MNRYKKLLSDTAIYGIGTFASKILVFFLTRLYTECLTKAEYGTADLITNIANLLIPLAAAGLCDGIFRFTLDKQADKSSVFSTGIFLMLAIGAVFAVASPLLMLIPRFRDYFWLIILYVIMSNFHSAEAQYIRALDRTKLFAVQGIINTVLTISFNILFLVVLPDDSFLNGVYGYVLSIVIADFVVGCFLFVYAKLWKDLSVGKFDKSVARDMLKYSLPLIPTTVFWWITNVSDRYMVAYFKGEAENGLYAAAYKIPTLLTLVTGVFSEAWQFSAVKEDDPEARSSFYSTVFACFQGLIFIAAGFIVAFSKIFSKILFADDYYTAWTFIPVLAIAGLFSSFVNFLSSVYLVKKRTMNSFFTAMVGALTNIVMNVLLIPDALNFGSICMPCAGMGAQGAAVATVVSYFVVFILRSIDAGRMIKFDMHPFVLSLNSVILVLASVAMILIPAGQTVLLIACEAILLAGLMIINAKALIKGVKTALSK